MNKELRNAISNAKRIITNYNKKNGTNIEFEYSIKQKNRSNVENNVLNINVNSKNIGGIVKNYTTNLLNNYESKKQRTIKSDYIDRFHNVVQGEITLSKKQYNKMKTLETKANKNMESLHLEERYTARFNTIEGYNRYIDILLKKQTKKSILYNRMGQLILISVHYTNIHFFQL